MGRPGTILIRSNICFISCSNHTSVSAKKSTCEIAVHFNKEKHLLSDFELIVIEQIRNIDAKRDVEKNRPITREAFLCAQLCTLQTYGLNKRLEFSSKKRIEYNQHISPFELHLFFFHHFLIVSF